MENTIGLKNAYTKRDGIGASRTYPIAVPVLFSQPPTYRGSNMSVHVLFNLLNELRESNKRMTNSEVMISLIRYYIVRRADLCNTVIFRGNILTCGV